MPRRRRDPNIEDLFAHMDDAELHARRTDPSTSHESAENLAVAHQAFLVLFAYRNGEELTDHEAYRRAGFPPGRTSHQRCSDLRDWGFIERTKNKKPSPFGKAAFTSVITTLGLAVIQRPDRRVPRPPAKASNPTTE